MRIAFTLMCVLLLSPSPELNAQTPSAAAASTAYAGKAIRLMQERNYRDAAVEFENALAASPNDDDLRVQYAVCLFEQHRDGDARAQFEILRRKKGEWPGLNYYLGILDYRVNDFDSTIRRLQPLEGSTFPQASYYVGMAYQSEGKAALALENLEHAVKDNPGDPQMHYGLGRAYSMSGRTEDANREYKLYHDLGDSRQLLESYGAACADALHARPIEEARQVCGKIGTAETGGPDELAKMLLVGRLYAQAGAFADAVAPLKRAVELDPGSFDGWNFLGRSLFFLHRYQDAIPPLRKTVALNPQYFDALNLLAASLHAQGDDASALPFLERAHNLNPNDAVVTGALEKMRAAVKGSR